MVTNLCVLRFVDNNYDPGDHSVLTYLGVDNLSLYVGSPGG